MTIIKGRRTLVYLAASLAALPLVLAASPRTGFGALDSAITLMSKIFYPSILLRNQTVQVGFFKFLYFIIIFAAANWILQKVFNKGGSDETGKRAATVIAFAFGGIAAWFMPVPVALGVAAMMTTILIAIVPVGVAIGLTYVAFAMLKDEWWQHLLGAALILLAIVIIDWTIAII
jgi:hypothetical protein